jgi:hypothetical protein
MGRACSMHQWNEKCIQKRSKCRLKNNIKVSFSTVEGCTLDSFGSGQGLAANSCVYRNKCSSSIKSREFLKLLSDY